MEDLYEDIEALYRQQLGAAVRSAREAQGLSLRSLALMSDVDFKYLSKLERGNANVTINVLVRLSSALGVKVSSLFAFELER